MPPFFHQSLDSLKGITLYDGWMGMFCVILIGVPLIGPPLIGERACGIGFLAEGVPNVFFILYCQAGTKKKLKKLSKADINEKFQKEKVTTNYTLVSRECPNSPIKRCSTSA